MLWFPEASTHPVRSPLMMNNIIWIVGFVVIVLVILSFLGFR